MGLLRNYFSKQTLLPSEGTAYAAQKVEVSKFKAHSVRREP